MSRADVYAVVDQGSTSTKCALVDSSGRMSSEISEPTQQDMRQGRIELDAGALADSVQNLLARTLASASTRAIGLTCQRSTCLIWDRQNGNPLTPALSWQDTSQAPRTRALASHAKDVAELTGLRLSPYYAAVKLAALLEEIPDGHARAATGELVAGTLDAFLVHRLTGTPATEPGHAGRTLLYNLNQGNWDSELCGLFGIPAAALPTLHPSAGPWGRHLGVPLSAVAGDQQAALLGHGGWSPGTVAAHFGTGAFVLASVGRRVQRSEGLLSAVLASTASGRRFQLEGSVNSAGSAIDWVCDLTGQDLGAWVDRPLIPEQVPWVVPALAGLGAPWWRPHARGLIRGLGVSTSGEDLVGGMIFGVAMRVVDNLEAMAAAGTKPDVVRVSGKLTRLRGLVGLIADAARIPVEVSRTEEAGLIGISRLAATGLDSDESALDLAPQISRRRDPQWSTDRAEVIRRNWRTLIESSFAD
jgi:glycerol kinase